MNTGKLIVIRKFNQDADWTRTDAENWAKVNAQSPDPSTGMIRRGGWLFKVEGAKKFLVKRLDIGINEYYDLSIKALRAKLGLSRKDKVVLSPF